MKNTLKPLFFIAAFLFADFLATSQENLKKTQQTFEEPSEKNRFGAPFHLRQNKSGIGINRKTIREPINLEKQFDREVIPKKGKNHSETKNAPKDGMNRSDKTEESQLAKILGLTSDQVKAMRTVRARFLKACKKICNDEKSSADQKQAQFDRYFKQFIAEVKSILSPDQFTLWKKLRCQIAKPCCQESNSPQPVNNANSKPNTSGNRENIAHFNRHIAIALKLTDEQNKLFRSIHQHAVKRIRAIVNNKELGKEEKKKLIGQVHKTAHNRRIQVLTAEQYIKLSGIQAFLQSKNNSEYGRPLQPTASNP